ncbi:uncharacterized protein C3orf38 homolog [Eleutherodactylus coqui]|uniref:uncharacterized protein C3orf38 homolog n=1 Tax=Eleutherodactylus coqui TaxID=57060 RepID=UPI00346327B8
METFAEDTGEVVPYYSVVTEVLTDDFGRQLCKWFYYTLPTQIHQCFDEFASNFFMDNVHLQCVYSIYGQNKLECSGLKMITWVLYGIFKEENLNFSPNLDFGGLKTEHDRYGILTVKVSGTVHKDNSYIGIFDHTFKAVQLPGKKEFKIKSVQLNMQT